MSHLDKITPFIFLLSVILVSWIVVGCIHEHHGDASTMRKSAYESESVFATADNKESVNSFVSCFAMWFPAYAKRTHITRYKAVVILWAPIIPTGMESDGDLRS